MFVWSLGCLHLSALRSYCGIFSSPTTVSTDTSSTRAFLKMALPEVFVAWSAMTPRFFPTSNGLLTGECTLRSRDSDNQAELYRTY